MRWAQNESEVALTFSREVAYRHPNIELIHAAHPLSRWAARGIGAHHHAFSIALDHSDALAKGKYVFALCFLESSNARTPLRVTGLVARAGDGLVSLSESRDVARVMGELLDNGLDEALPWEVGTPAPESVANVLETVHTALDTLVHEQNKRDHELHELREAAATARGLAGLRAALSRAEGLLDRYRTEGAAPFVTRMQEAKVARARERVEESERQPAARQWAEPERHDVAVGLISVRH
jgi:hypothetical protein